jgi:hypothetical protein
MTNELKTSSKVPRFFMIGAAVLGLIAVAAAFLYFGGGTQASASGNKLNMPVQQQKFCKILLDGYLTKLRLQKQIDAERNPFRQDALNKQSLGIADRVFDDLFALIGSSGKFEGWRGTLGFSKPDNKGKMQATVSFTCPLDGYPEFKNNVQYMETQLFHYVHLATGYSFTDKQETGIPYSSPLGQTVAAFDEGERVAASGTFVWAPPGDTSTRSMTIVGKNHFHPSDIGIPIRLNGGQLGLCVRFSSIAHAP